MDRGCDCLAVSGPSFQRTYRSAGDQLSLVNLSLPQVNSIDSLLRYLAVELSIPWAQEPGDPEGTYPQLSQISIQSTPLQLVGLPLYSDSKNQI